MRFLLALALVAAVAARADEIRLKDGSKIIGTIVGFEDGSFKVQTSYGFAMVQKDQIAEIIPTPPKPPAKPQKPMNADSPVAASTAASASDAPPTPANSLPDAAGDSPSASPSAAPTDAPASRPAKSVNASRASLPAAVRNPVPAPVPSPAPAPAAAPSAPLAAVEAVSTPRPLREEIVGNLYINRTYGFDIYKPPDWQMLPDEMHSLPNAVAAMGTDDSTTLLLVGRETRKGALEAQAAATDTELHDIYDNIRLISAAQSTVAGEPAIERHFRGSAAGQDWSVTVVSVAHGSDLFTVLGMTYADSDLIQIQENVIARAISSLRFEQP